MSHDYKCWHKALSKELCEYMDCFEDEPKVETLCIVKELAKTIKTLYEIEAYEIMFDCLEGCFGYDREEHEFEDKENGGGMDYVMFSIYNAYNPARMTRGTPHYPSTTGREYGTGVDRRYGEYSTDKSMYPYGGYGHEMYGMMNAADGRGMNGRNGTNGNGGYRGDSGMGGRTGDNGSRGASYQNRYYPDDSTYGDWDDEYGEKYHRGNWMNADRGGRRGEGGGERRRDTRGRYIMNHADVEKAKSMKPLDEKTIDEWMEELVDDKGHEGPMFSKEESNALAKKVGVTFNHGYNQNEFWATLNMIYSDTNTALDANGQTAKPETYARLAKNWLEDVDSSIDGSKKLAVYYHEIVDADED